MARFQASTLAIAAILSGCATGFDATIVTPGTGEVVMGVAAELTHGRLIQSIVSAYTPADVDHMGFDLYKQGEDGSFTPVASQETPAGTGTTKTGNFAHLKMNTTYKVEVKCFDEGDVDITKAGTGIATVTTTTDDYVPVTVSVTLADKTFDGTLHPVVNVSAGTVVNTGSAESGSVADNQ